MDWARVIFILTRFMIFAVPAFAFVLSIHQLKGGWDDGAITAAFSRTLAETGRFALTPVSEKVEGFSSVAWVFLLTLPYYLFHSTIAILAWMKLLAALSFLLALIVFRRLADRLLGDPVQADLATILAAFVLCPLLETLNGMEMNFYMLLVLWLVDVLTDEQRRHRALWIWALTFALIATRFESPFLVTALLAGLLLSRDGRAFRQMAMAAATAFGMTELWRYHEFGVWMPNTVYAKMWPPYSPPHHLVNMFWARALAVAEIVEVLGGPLLALLCVAAGCFLWKRLALPLAGKAHEGKLRVLLLGTLVLITWRSLPYLTPAKLTHHALYLFLGCELLAIALILGACLGRQANRLETLTAAMVASGMAFGMLFGKNWGYAGRMILPCFPFLALAIAHFVSRHLRLEAWRRTALAGCVLCQLLTWVPAAQQAWADGFGVPAWSVENFGRAGDAVRRLSDLESLSILLPDVGGSSLYGERLQVLDSALLANSSLAHRGYKAFGEFLQKNQPQVIETHGMWSELTGVYQNERVSNYSLAVVDGSRLLLRNDVYARTYSRLMDTTGVHMGSDGQCLGTNPKSSVDTEFVEMRKSCLCISREDLVRNGIAIE
jgi:hypothetical protein